MRLKIGDATGYAEYVGLATRYGPRDGALNANSIGAKIGGALLTIGIVALVVLLTVITLVV